MFRHASSIFDAFTNNGSRFIIASLIMLLLSWYHHQKTKHPIFPIFQFLYTHPILSIFIFIFLGIRIIIMSTGTLHTSSLSNSLWLNLLIPLNFLVHYIFYERKRLLSHLFWVGILVCIIGITIFIKSTSHIYPIEGFFHISIGILCQLIIIQLTKKIPKEYHSIHIDTAIHLGIGIILCIISFWTRPQPFSQYSSSHIILLVGNGVLCGLLLYCITMLNYTPLFIPLQLAIPFLVIPVATNLFREYLSWMEFLGTIVTICGIYLCILQDKINTNKDYQNE